MKKNQDLSSEKALLDKEAQVIATYLLGKKANGQVINLYQQAMQVLELNYINKDRKILQLLMKRRYLLPYLDAGLAILRPNSVVRQKILVMSAIIETQYQYASLFLNQKLSCFYLFTIAWVGTRSILKAILGIILVKVI